MTRPGYERSGAPGYDAAQATAYTTMRHDPAVWHESLRKAINATYPVIARAVLEEAQRRVGNDYDQRLNRPYDRYNEGFLDCLERAELLTSRLADELGTPTTHDEEGETG